LEDHAIDDVGIFYGHLVYVGILWPFGIFCGYFVYFFTFWYFVPRKIWQPWFRKKSLAQKKEDSLKSGFPWLKLMDGGFRMVCSSWPEKKSIKA
jgi:hypothetical protein